MRSPAGTAAAHAAGDALGGTSGECGGAIVPECRTPRLACRGDRCPGTSRAGPAPWPRDQPTARCCPCPPRRWPTGQEKLLVMAWACVGPPQTMRSASATMSAVASPTRPQDGDVVPRAEAVADVARDGVGVAVHRLVDHEGGRIASPFVGLSPPSASRRWHALIVRVSVGRHQGRRSLWGVQVGRRRHEGPASATSGRGQDPAAGAFRSAMRSPASRSRWRRSGGRSTSTSGPRARNSATARSPPTRCWHRRLDPALPPRHRLGPPDAEVRRAGRGAPPGAGRAATAENPGALGAMCRGCRPVYRRCWLAPSTPRSPGQEGEAASPVRGVAYTGTPAPLSASMLRAGTVRSDTSSSAASWPAVSRPRGWGGAAAGG